MQWDMQRLVKCFPTVWLNCKHEKGPARHFYILHCMQGKVKEGEETPSLPCGPHMLLPVVYFLPPVWCP